MQESKVNVEARDVDGCNALQYAAFRWYYEAWDKTDRPSMSLVAYLTQQCAVNVDAKNNDGWNAFHFACDDCTSRLDVIVHLVRKCHINVNAKNKQ